MIASTKEKTKYTIKFTTEFKKDYRKLLKQHRDINKLKYVVNELANGRKLDLKYKNHLLSNSKYYKNCGECHIEPDWLLIYKYGDAELILLLVATGSNSELF